MASGNERALRLLDSLTRRRITVAELQVGDVRLVFAPSQAEMHTARDPLAGLGRTAPQSGPELGLYGRFAHLYGIEVPTETNTTAEEDQDA